MSICFVFIRIETLKINDAFLIVSVGVSSVEVQNVDRHVAFARKTTNKDSKIEHIDRLLAHQGVKWSCKYIIAQ